jgi:hypothetical protein
MSPATSCQALPVYGQLWTRNCGVALWPSNSTIKVVVTNGILTAIFNVSLVTNSHAQAEVMANILLWVMLMVEVSLKMANIVLTLSHSLWYKSSLISQMALFLGGLLLLVFFIVAHHFVKSATKSFLNTCIIFVLFHFVTVCTTFCVIFSVTCDETLLVIEWYYVWM